MLDPDRLATRSRRPRSGRRRAAATRRADRARSTGRAARTRRRSRPTRTRRRAARTHRPPRARRTSRGRSRRARAPSGRAPRASTRCRRAARSGRRRGRGPSTAAPGQAEHALADDVALDLRRARRDRERERAQSFLDELVVVDVQRVAVQRAGTARRTVGAPRSRRASSPSHPGRGTPRVACETLRFVSAHSASNSAMQRPSSVRMLPRSRSTIFPLARSSQSRIESTSSLTNAVPRSYFSVTLVTRQPSFSAPTRFATGTRTSVRKTPRRTPSSRAPS